MQQQDQNSDIVMDTPVQTRKGVVYAPTDPAEEGICIGCE